MERADMLRLLRTPVPDTDRWVLLCLALHSGRENVAYPSVPTIAAELNVTERTVQRALRRLAEQGHVVPTEPSRGGRGRSTHYLIPPRKGDTQGDTLSRPKG